MKYLLWLCGLIKIAGLRFSNFSGGEEEAKPAVIEPSLDQKMDDIFDNHEQKTPESPSDSKPIPGKEPSKETPPGSDQPKPDKDAPKEEDIPKEFHKHPKWQKLLKDRNDAQSKLVESETKGSLSDDDRQLLEDAKTVTSTREGIETLMKAKGFTQEKIDEKLREKGFGVTPEGDVSFVCKSLEIDESKLKPHQKEDIEDITKISRVIMKDMLGKAFTEELAPVKEHIAETNRGKSATVVTDRIKATVKEDGILDYDKDIVPEINKFLDANPKANQEDVLSHFNKINHTLTVSRLKTSKGQKTRDDQKLNLRGNSKAPINLSGLSKKTGNFHKDSDELLDSLGVH